MLSKWGKKNLCQISLVKFPIVHYQGTVHSIDPSFFSPSFGNWIKFKTFPFPFYLVVLGCFFFKYLNAIIFSANGIAYSYAWEV